jgi:hypothetical protein
MTSRGKGSWQGFYRDLAVLALITFVAPVLLLPTLSVLYQLLSGVKVNVASWFVTGFIAGAVVALFLALLTWLVAVFVFWRHETAPSGIRDIFTWLFNPEVHDDAKERREALIAPRPAWTTLSLDGATGKRFTYRDRFRIDFIPRYDTDPDVGEYVEVTWEFAADNIETDKTKPDREIQIYFRRTAAFRTDEEVQSPDTPRLVSEFGTPSHHARVNFGTSKTLHFAWHVKSRDYDPGRPQFVTIERPPRVPALPAEAEVPPLSFDDEIEQAVREFDAYEKQTNARTNLDIGIKREMIKIRRSEMERRIKEATDRARAAEARARKKQ